jgi:hypothetical protein
MVTRSGNDPARWPTRVGTAVAGCSGQARTRLYRAGGRIRLVSVLAAALPACIPAISGITGQPATEYRIRAAFLYDFTRFVSWPDDVADTSGFTLCVLDNAPFGKLVNGRPLLVRRLGSLTQLRVAA